MQIRPPESQERFINSCAANQPICFLVSHSDGLSHAGSRSFKARLIEFQGREHRRPRDAPLAGARCQTLRALHNGTMPPPPPGRGRRGGPRTRPRLSEAPPLPAPLAGAAPVRRFGGLGGSRGKKGERSSERIVEAARRAKAVTAGAGVGRTNGETRSRPCSPPGCRGNAAAGHRRRAPPASRRICAGVWGAASPDPADGRPAGCGAPEAGSLQPWRACRRNGGRARAARSG